MMLSTAIPVTSEAPALIGPPVSITHVSSVDPETPDKTVLTLDLAAGIEVLAATTRLTGQRHTANLINHADIDTSGGRVLIDFSAPRPFTRVNFLPNGGTAQLMIQLGGTWFQPATVAGIDFGSYQDNDPFPELITEQVLLAGASGVTDIESRSYPANVTLRVTDGGVPFFFHRGDLRGEVPIPDFGQQLALALETCEPVDGRCTLDVIAHSEAFGRLTAADTRVEYRLVHNGLDGLTDEQRTVTVPVEDSASFAVQTPSGAHRAASRPPVEAVTLNMVALGISPVYAPTDGRRGAVVSEQFSVAQSVDVESEITVANVHLYLSRRASEASLALELRTDADGEPQGEVLATASVAVDALPEAGFAWAAATLEDPVTVPAPSRLWLVLKADTGAVEWRGDDVPAGAQPAFFSSDRGNSWVAHPMTASYALQRFLPDPDAPLTITLAVGGEQQDVRYEPASFPLVLDADSALVRGLNQGLGASATLPAIIPLTIHTDASLSIQLVWTQFDLTYNLAAGAGVGSQASIIRSPVVEALPVTSIDGIDEVFAGALATAGVRSVGDLSALDQSVADMPAAVLHEVRTKARLALDLEVDLSPLQSLMDMDISAFLQGDPAALVSAAAVSAEQIEQIQDELAVLQVSLDERELRQMTLRDLIG